MPKPHLTFLFLKAFDTTGGIEKMNRVILRALADWQKNGAATVQAWSPYEYKTDLRYFPAEQFRGYAGRRWAFLGDLLWRPPKTDILLLSHVNLAPAALLLKLRYPRLRIQVWAHGIELWRPLGWLKKQLLRRADRILAVSEFTRRQIIKWHGIEAERITVLPNCLDPFFQPPACTGKPTHLLQRYGLQPEQPVLITMARMNREAAYKGYDKVLACLPELQKQFPDIRYLLCGDCDSAERARLDELIHLHGIGHRVLFPGFLPDSELAAHYQVADLLVMPSTGEGFGIVFIEAMACGTPALGGNRDGSPEALAPGALGYAVDPDDPVALRTAIADALTCSGRAEALQKKVLERFDYTRYSTQLWRILSKK